MMEELERFLKYVRPAFSRRATYVWFVIVFAGFLLRSDSFGVSSIVRALSLAPENYTCLLHFFHSSAWTVEGLMSLWWTWLAGQNVAERISGRLVIVGDHTKTPKDARKMPGVTTLHQDSETSSKPSFFRGHHWGCIGLLVAAAGRFLAVPLWANIQEGLDNVDQTQDRALPKTTRIVKMAQRVAMHMGQSAYLLLDAFFAVGPVFEAAAELRDGDENLVHVLTKAKKNIVAYQPARPSKKKKRGRKKKYGKRLRLAKLFDSKARAYTFQTADARIYNRTETIRYLTLDLLWKPIKSMLRFILVESSRGRMILISSDLNINPITAVELFCRRVTIETLFDTLKNILAGLAYHFWSKHLTAASRRPRKKKTATVQHSSNPSGTLNTLNAIEKFVNVQLLVLGILQLIARLLPEQVKANANCWLRTSTSNTPSEFVTRCALSNLIKNNLSAFAKDPIMRLIFRIHKSRKRTASYRKAA